MTNKAIWKSIEERTHSIKSQLIKQVVLDTLNQYTPVDKLPYESAETMFEVLGVTSFNKTLFLRNRYGEYLLLAYSETTKHTAYVEEPFNAKGRLPLNISLMPHPGDDFIDAFIMMLLHFFHTRDLYFLNHERLSLTDKELMEYWVSHNHPLYKPEISSNEQGDTVYKCRGIENGGRYNIYHSFIFDGETEELCGVYKDVRYPNNVNIKLETLFDKTNGIREYTFSYFLELMYTSTTR